MVSNGLCEVASWNQPTPGRSFGFGAYDSLDEQSVEARLGLQDLAQLLLRDGAKR